MSDLCAPTFEHLAASLGFSCGQADGLAQLRSPLALENWTLPVLEATVITGAVLALIYAVVRYRRHGDATNLVLWFGAIAYLLIIEPPLYFPAAFGIADRVDTMFAHNVFSINFLWGRLPLYIVAIYPMMATVAFEIVRVLGVFRRYGALIGAVCVGLVHHVFYEVFDHLGPQLRWWEWSVDNPLNQPMFDSVPLGSVVVFAALWPISLAWCVHVFVGRHIDDGQRLTGRQVAWRTVAVGVLASIGTAVLPLPATVTGAFTNPTVQGIVYVAEFVVVAAIAVPVLVAQWRRLRGEPGTAGRYASPLIIGYSLAYLAVMTLLWISALPAYFGAVAGVTGDGDPVGSLWYATTCLVVAAVCSGAAITASPPTSTDRPATPGAATGQPSRV
jgi:hypothetical protein